MILKISGKIPQGEQLTVKVNSVEKTLDYAVGCVSFDLQESGNYEAEIIERPSKNELTWPGMIVYIITIFFRGLLNIFFMSVDGNWYRKIRPYIIRTSFTVTVDDSAVKMSEISFTYKPSSYNKELSDWDKPSLVYDPDLPHKTDFYPNLPDFKNQYVKYAKRLISVEAILFLTMLLFLIAGVYDKNVAVIVLMSLSIATSVFTTFLVARKHYKKYKSLLKSFTGER